jgi:diacylglycerol kinase
MKNIKYLGMFTNQPSWFESFGFVLTLWNSEQAVRIRALLLACEVTLTFLLHWELVRPVVPLGFVAAGKTLVD